MPRLVERTGLALEPARAAVFRDPCEALRTVPEAPFFIVLLFFKRIRDFAATAHAWKFTLPSTVPRSGPKKLAPDRERSDLFVT